MGELIMPVSFGKKRGLSQCSTERNVFCILALDHRGNLKKAMNPDDPDRVSFNSMVEFKLDVISTISPFTSAVLIDPEIGTAPAISSGAIPGSVGLIIAVEATGYTGKPNERVSKILPGWGVDKVRRIGASGVKLLVYYHPDSEFARQQEDLTEQVADKCIQYDIPLFLEPLSFSLDPKSTKLPSSELREVVIETARRLSPLGIDVLKAEFPLNVMEEQDESVWANACYDLNSASKVPWTLLSAGVEFETFLRQALIALKAGASGVLAGRAIWKEAAEMHGDSRREFLKNIAADRMARLATLCNSTAKPWIDTMKPAEDIDIPWYQEYQGLE
jgi:tagatose 1,6-diphosphate aldolase